MEFEKLVKNLSTESREIFEKAVAIASSRSHFYIDIEHWLAQAYAQDEKSVIAVSQHFDLSLEHVQQDINASLESIKTGNDGFPKISPDVVRLLFEAWMLASSQFGSVQVRPVHILLAAVDNNVLKLRLTKISSEFAKLSGDDIKMQCESLLRSEMVESNAAKSAGGTLTKTPSLDQFTTNLTELARQGKIDAVLGRDNEIRQMIDILCRRKQNNPILTGEAGVGKTAVVEGLAVRIAQDEVPDIIKGIELMSLDLGLLQAGAGVKGEFENRLKGVIKEAQNSAKPVVLFIDEAHTLIGAGNQSGAGDAANLLKPALARGELRTIAATTWAEYKKYFESDAALTRRFQVVKVEEPTEPQAIVMLRSVAPALEKHHKVVVLDEAVTAAVSLSHRYIAGRQLPDKCVSLLDTACARVNLSLSTKPASLENYEREIANIDFEISRLTAEKSNGYQHDEKIVELEVQKLSVQGKREELQQRWDQERQLIGKISGLRKDQEQSSKESADGRINDSGKKIAKALAKCRSDLAATQCSSPLMYECVDAQVVAEVVADWTGIPVGRMQSDEIKSVLAIEEYMEKRVVGQSHGLKLIAKAVQTARAKLSDPKRPLGVFMLVGPSGVGKTETALALAEQLYGSEQNMTVINMSEFKEEHKVSLLMGSPPGYVGYGEGGILTEAVRRKPYSVVLLDEMEKAHPGVQDIFYQVFDKGILRDGEGRDIDFKNTVIIMTSNTASEQIDQLCMDPDTKPLPEGLLDAIGPTLRDTYKPAFLGRVNVIPYYPLEVEFLAEIARMQLKTIQERVKSNYHVALVFSDVLVNSIVEQCQQSDIGARKIATLLNNTLLPILAEELLSAMASEANFDSVFVDVGKNNEFLIQLKTSGKKQKKNTPRKTLTS